MDVEPRKSGSLSAAIDRPSSDGRLFSPTELEASEKKPTEERERGLL
jgi:hypothetical protein